MYKKQTNAHFFHTTRHSKQQRHLPNTHHNPEPRLLVNNNKLRVIQKHPTDKGSRHSALWNDDSISACVPRVLNCGGEERTDLWMEGLSVRPADCRECLFSFVTTVPDPRGPQSGGHISPSWMPLLRCVAAGPPSLIYANHLFQRQLTLPSLLKCLCIALAR